MIKEGLTFDDVLLQPQFSDVLSRGSIDLSVKMNGLTFGHPIIPANMKTVTDSQLASEAIRHGGLAILHRFMPLALQLEIVKGIKFEFYNLDNLGVSIGVQLGDKEAVKQFVEAGVKIVCIDIAHGDSQQCVEMVAWIKKTYPTLLVIAGNVATASGAEHLWMEGADAVKVGVGPGSLCTTRIETGNGVPQLTALMEVHARRQDLTMLRQDVLGNYSSALTRTIKRPIYIIADGGIKSAGDIVKALCFSDMVMVGNLFAGCDEAPGHAVHIDGRKYKEYVGSSTHKTNHIEGVAAMVECKGPFKDILTKLTEGLRSGCSYQGVHNLVDLKRSPEFIRISNAGLVESHPHDVKLK